MSDDTIQIMKVKGFGTKRADCFVANLLFIIEIKETHHFGVSIINE